MKTEWYFSHHKKDKADVSFNSEGTVWKCAILSVYCQSAPTCADAIDMEMDDAVSRITDARLAEKAREFQVRDIILSFFF